MILLTGGTGFLGRYIIDQLRREGRPLRLLVRNPDKFSAPEGVEVVQGDIMDVYSLEKALEGVEYVIHSAAVVSFWKKRRPELKAINVDGTANVVNTCLNAGVKKLIHISSVAALGRSKGTTPITEASKWVKSNFNTWYGRTKYLAELEVQRGVQEGLPAVIANPAIIIGAGNWDSGSPRMFKMIHGGLKFYNPGITGFVPAIDVANGAIKLMDSDFQEGERFLLVSDSLPYKTFFAWVAESVKGKAPSIAPPRLLGALVGHLSVFFSKLKGKEPLITPETMRISRGKFNYDGSKITRELDFEYHDLKSIVMETGKKYLAEHGS